MRNQNRTSGKLATSRGITWPSTVLLALFLLELVLATPAVAQHVATSAPVISQPRSAPWSFWGIVRLAIAILLAVLPAAIRLDRWFHPFLGLGVFANRWSGLYLSFMSLIAGVSYSGISQLISTSSLLGGSLSTVGGGTASHAVTLLGRLKKRRVREPEPPGEADTSPGKLLPNGLHQTIYEGAWDRIVDRMRYQRERMAEAHDWPTIRDVCSQLIEDQMANPRSPLAPLAGKDLIKKIRALHAADQPNSKYSAIRWTIAVTSFRALRSRLSAEKAKKEATHS